MNHALKRSPLETGELPLKVIGMPPTSYFTKYGSAVLTFGIFDGVHLGQQAILRQVSKRAEASHVPSAAIVFRPRPVETLGISPQKPYLTAQDTTVQLIRSLSIRHVGVLRFTRELTEMPASQFLRRLVRRIPIQELWLGAKATVGRGPEGSLSSVQQIGEELGFTVKVFDPQETLPTNRNVMDHFNIRDLSSVARDLGRRYKLPAYIARSSLFTQQGIAEFILLAPRLLYIPPDGAYAVMVHPASYGSAQIGPNTSKGLGILIVRTSRNFGSEPELRLIGDPLLGWSGSFVNLEFLQAFNPTVDELWQWAKHLYESEKLLEESARNVQGVRDGGDEQEQQRHHLIQS